MTTWSMPHGLGLIGDVDTLIAATALEHWLTIVTLDGDFARAWAGSDAADVRRFAGIEPAKHVNG